MSEPPVSASSAFARAVEIVLVREGLLSDQVADEGGLTKYGIALNAHPDLTSDQIRALTRDQAIAIYRARYWTRCGCEALDWVIALPLFDGAVQHGAATAVALLQQALGVTPDGAVGPRTLAAVAGCADKPALLAEYMANRILLYAEQPSWPRFKRGWSRRAVSVTIAAIAG